MYWQNNQQNQRPPTNHFSPGNRSNGNSPYGGESGNPFRSPMHRPRYQSSPRYQTQYGSPFPDPYRCPQEGIRTQRSPHNSCSPRHDLNYTSPPPSMGKMDSSYQRGNQNRRSSAPMSDNGRGRGKGRYSGGWDNFPSPGTGESNPGGSSDIRLYYSPDMVNDPWANLQSSNSFTQSSS